MPHMEVIALFISEFHLIITFFNTLFPLYVCSKKLFFIGLRNINLLYINVLIKIIYKL